MVAGVVTISDGGTTIFERRVGVVVGVGGYVVDGVAAIIDGDVAMGVRTIVSERDD